MTTDIVSIVSTPNFTAEELLTTNNLDIIDRALSSFDDGNFELSSDVAKKLAERQLDLVDKFSDIQQKAKLAESYHREQAADHESVARSLKSLQSRIKNLFIYLSKRSGRDDFYGKTRIVKIERARLIKMLQDPARDDFFENANYIDTDVCWTVDKPTPEIIKRLHAAGLGDLLTTKFKWRLAEVEAEIKKDFDDHKFKKWFTTVISYRTKFQLNKYPKKLISKIEKIEGEA